MTSSSSNNRPSPISVVPSANKNPAKPLLIIINPNTARDWNLEREDIYDIYDIYVYKNKTLACLRLEDLRNWNDVEWRKPEDLFLPHLTFIDREAAFPGSIKLNINQPLLFNGSKITPLIPLDSILLEYFTPEDLAKRIQFSQDETTNTVRVTLTLPLAGINLQNRRFQEFKIYQDYPLHEECSLFDVPVLEIWPKFRLTNWQEYYAFYYDINLGDRTFNVEFSQAKEPHSFEENQGKYLITRLSEFPSHVCCVDSYRESLGLILIKQPPVLNPTAKWKVGLDFGSNFTNIYVNDRGAVDRLKINPLDEKDSLHLEVTESDGSTRMNVLFEYFIPERFIPTDSPLPLASILTTRGQTRGNRPRPIYDGRIYIPKYGNTQHREIENNYIETDLPNKPQSTQLFLHNLALFISAIAAKQGVKQIQWSISYPSAFSNQNLNQYEKIWKNIAAELQPKTGIQQLFSEQIAFQPLSLAIARYFVDRENFDAIRSTFIYLDTDITDVSLWQNNQQIHQCSLYLTEKHLFIHIIEHRPELLAKWFDNQDNWDNLAPDIFRTKIDLLLREKSERWLREERHNYEEDLDFLGLVRIVSLGMAGLYYYIGITIKTLCQEGKYTESKVPSTYIGGNGCRLLNWLVPTGEFSSFAGINELFNRLLSKASGLDEVGDPTRVSKAPQDEVACGLVMSRTKLSEMDSKQKAQDHPIAGENFSIKGHEFAFHDRLNLKNVGSDINHFIIPDLQYLKKFVNEFNDAVVELGIEDIQPLPTYKYKQGLDSIYSNRLWDEVDRELKNTLFNMSGEATAIRTEPPFILGLKALLTVFAREWGDDNRGSFDAL
jgi:hypothetical protein